VGVSRLVVGLNYYSSTLIGNEIPQSRMSLISDYSAETTFGRVTESKGLGSIRQGDLVH
jgi:hypothetical protein